MADVTYSDTITLGELMLSVLKMTDALSVETKKTLVMSASIAGDATAMAKAIASDKYTEILFHALVGRVAKRWRFESFRGPRGGNPAESSPSWNHDVGKFTRSLNNLSNTTTRHTRYFRGLN
jgi:hypothetical protein